MGALAKTPFPYQQSYWMMNHEVPTAAPLAGEHVADVVIVGGGFAGLSTALGLLHAQPDLKVTLIEAQHIGYGASGRNGGQIMNFPPPTWMLEDLDQAENRELIDLHHQLAAEQLDLVATSVMAAGVPSDMEPGRIAGVARNAFEVAGVRWAHDLLRGAGIDSELYLGEAAQARSCTPAKAALDLPTTRIQPFELAQGLRQALLARGATIFESTPAKRVENTADGVRVETAGGVIRADRAVLTTNAYLLQNRVELDRSLPKTSILHTYLIATERLDPDVFHRIFPTGEGFGDAALTFFYGRPHDGRLLFGGMDRTSKNTVADDQREASFRALHAEMLARFPFLRDVPLSAAWGGAVQETRDSAPIIRRTSEGSNIILNMGFGGNSGVNGSISSGRLVPSLVLEKDDADARRILTRMQSPRVPWGGLARAALGLLSALFRS